MAVQFFCAFFARVRSALLCSLCVLTRSAKFRILTAVGGSVALAGLYWLLSPSLVIQSGNLPFFLYLLLFCLLLHHYSALAVISLAMAAFGLMHIANESKISLTGLPLTLIDIRLFLSDPNGTRNALKIGDAEFLIAMAPLLLPSLFVVARAKQILGLPLSLHRLRVGGTTLVALCAIVTAFSLFLIAYVRAVDSAATSIEKGLWEPRGVEKLCRALGLVGFLSYSYSLERMNVDHRAWSIKGTSPLDPELNAVVGKYVKPAGASLRKLPNIVLVHIESTFDPNYVFALSRPVESELFQSNKYTQAIGPIYVNAVGGGSWISEFEALTGVDSRFFGYVGYYTHTSLSPFVTNSFVHFLKRKGYRAAAFYPVPGDFFNAKNAFIKYGFESFLDKSALDLKAPGWWSTDEEIVRAVISKFREADDAPFFWYISLLENHAPHTCRNFTEESEFLVQFDQEASFEENCTLNEYVRVLKSTSNGFKELLSFLEGLEARTGRPFVVLGYGDHQPHSFTGTGGGTTTFARFRRVLDPRYTFFHLMSSVPGVVRCCDGLAPHLTIVPTLLSGYVAAGVDDLYLRVNLYAFDRCGSDPFSASMAVKSNVLKGYQERSDLEVFESQAGPLPSKQTASKSCGMGSALLAAYSRSRLFSAGLLGGE